MATMRLLLAEDDPLLSSGLLSALGQAGYQVDHFSDGVSAQQALDCEHYDMLLLDLGLPGRDGNQILESLRRRGSTLPVLVLTARDEIDDRVHSLDLGADDYLIKPFDLGELLARIRALRRRYGGRPESSIRHQGLILNPDAHQVTLDGNEISLSAREFSLLEALLEHVGRVLSREQLEQSLYGWNEGIESNAIEVHIHKLRRKLGKPVIQTVRGVGYRIPKPGDCGH
jgi:DNA-binding response OmpR family regulator